MPRKDIFAAGYFGFGNFGDELILEIFKKRIGGICGVKALDRRKNGFIKTLKNLSSCACLVFPGGSVFQDETSLASLVYYFSLAAAAKFCRKPVFMLDQGFEVKSAAGRMLLKIALKLSKFTSVRDEASFRLAKSLGARAIKSADCAFAAELERKHRKFPPETVAVIPRGDPGVWKTLISKCSRKYGTLKYKTAILSPEDAATASEISGAAGSFSQISGIAGLLDFLNDADAALLAPYHSVVFSLILGIPFIAVGYSAKIRNLLEENHLEENIYRPCGEPVFRPLSFSPGVLRLAEESSFQLFLNLLENKLKP